MVEQKSTEEANARQATPGDDPMKAALRLKGAGGRSANRLRAQPAVIDGASGQGAGSVKKSDLGSLERDLGMMPTARVAPPSQQAPPQSTAPQPTTPQAPMSPAASQASSPVRQTPPQPVQKIKSSAASSKEMSQQAAASTVTSLVEQMKARAESNGGYLRTSDIEAMEQDLQSQVAALSSSMEQSFEAFVEAREKAEWDAERKFPFGRVIVKKFSHLFGESKEGRMDTISKRMLPGFFMGLKMMVGPENIDLYEERCRRVVEKIREAEGDAFVWTSVYRAPESNAVVLDTLMAIAPHFEKFERRQEWLIELINGNMPPQGDDSGEDSGWELTAAGYKRLLATLYSDLATLIADEAASSSIRKRYGNEAIVAVKDLIVQTKLKSNTGT